MKLRVLALVVLVAALAEGSRAAGSASLASAFALPTADTVRPLLEGAVHNSEFVRIGSTPAYVSYPDRGEKSPVVIINTEEGMSDWARALGYQASRDGFIAVVADERRPGGSAVQQFAAEIPAATGVVTRLDVRRGSITAHVSGAPAATFAFDDEGWETALRFLSARTHNHFSPIAHMDHVAMEMRARAPAAQAQGGRGAQTGRGAQPGQPRQAPGLNAKPDDLPANWVMAGKVANTTPRRNEWVDVPVPGTNVKVHTWVVYPAGEQKVGTVLVLHGASGMSDWIRSVADQLAQEGFIALAVDLSSGLGPNGGNFDSFRYTDDLMRATQGIGREGVMARIKAVRDYAAKMPRSNGRTGSIGFCGGGTNSFALATEVPEHNASVVYYGTAPAAAALARTTAPVLGFYGEDDARVFSTVEGTRAEMKKLGKAYEAHTYQHTTHSFLWMQDLGNNFEATADSWPRAIAFYRQHLNTPAPATR